MTDQSPRLRRLALSVGFPLACIVLTIATYAAFGGALPLGAHEYRVHIPIPNAQSVVVGSDVRTSGVKIGKVVDVARSADHADVTVELRPRFAPMHAQATAIVRVKTLLGEAYVEIAPGPASASAIPEGGWLAATQVRSAVTLDEFLSTFSAGTRQRMRDLFAGLAGAAKHRAPAINDTLGYSAPLTSDLDSVLRTLDAQNSQLQRLVAGSGDVMEALGRHSGSLRSAIAAADNVLGVTARRDRELAATVHALPAFLTELRATSRTVGAASPDLGRAAAALVPVAAPLGRTIRQTLPTAPLVREAFRELRPLITASDRGLPALTRIVRATPIALRTLYPALRELVPVIQLLAAYREPGLIGPLATVDAGANGKLVGPGGKIATHAGGTIYVANNSIGGWVKRLPSDRSNPYPKPDALTEMAHRGFLLSYDCRNTGNPMYLPTLGTGVPPCVTQGPWNYRGTTAYYPRLQRAPR